MQIVSQNSHLTDKFNNSTKANTTVQTKKSTVPIRVFVFIFEFILSCSIFNQITTTKSVQF